MMCICIGYWKDSFPVTTTTSRDVLEEVHINYYSRFSGSLPVKKYISFNRKPPKNKSHKGRQFWRHDIRVDNREAYIFLSPASEAWGRYRFHGCVSVHGRRRGRREVSLLIGPWSLVSDAFRGGPPGLWSQVLSRGYPCSLGTPLRY